MAAALSALVCTAAMAGPPPQHATPTAIFATEKNQSGHAAKLMPGVAAVVDGHSIAMNDVVILALRNNRSYVVDQMIQQYVVDRDCQRRGIVIPESEIDAKIAQLRKALAPKTLEAEIKEHGSSMAEVRYDFRQQAEKLKLVENQVPPTKMLHCREIVVKFRQEGAPENIAGTLLTDDQALAKIKKLQDLVKGGEDFGAVAKGASDGADRDKGGDMGVLFDGVHDVDANVITAALALGKGETTPEPVKMESGSAYCLIQAISTDSDHPKSEDGLYKDAVTLYHNLQAQFLGPKYVVDMINHSKIWVMTDEQLLSGKPLPKAAATVDGHPILMKDVIAKCMAQDGPRCTNILVESYVVDRECGRRHIAATKAEIDDHIADLERQIAPHSIQEALEVHHTTMAQLRRDFEQQIKRAKLVEDTVAPVKMVHCRAILVKDPQNPGEVQPAGMTSTSIPSAAQMEIDKIQSQLKSGASFADLSKKYPVDGTDGDVGVLYPGIQDMDTAILNAGLSLKGGQTSEAVKTVDGWCLVQAVSTSDSHPKAEDGLYAKALSTYKEQQAQMREPEYIIGLIKKSKVQYFAHS